MGPEGRRSAVFQQGDSEPALHPDRLRRRDELGRGPELAGDREAVGEDAGEQEFFAS